MAQSKDDSGKKPGRRRNNDYPFGTGDWDRWTNKKRLAWMTNYRDQCRDNFKEKLNISDEDIDEITRDVEALEHIVLYEEFTAANVAARHAEPKIKGAIMLGEIIDDICANDYYKAKRLGIDSAQIDKMRADADKYLREIQDWERRQNAKMILGGAPRPRKAEPTAEEKPDGRARLEAIKLYSNIDDTALLAAFESGIEADIEREWDEWIAKLEAFAETDPIFADWYKDFCETMERYLRWDDTIEIDDKV